VGSDPAPDDVRLAGDALVSQRRWPAWPEHAIPDIRSVLRIYTDFAALMAI
jgi:hypothetical protein